MKPPQSEQKTFVIHVIDTRALRPAEPDQGRDLERIVTASPVKGRSIAVSIHTARLF